MSALSLREIRLEDEASFLLMTNKSQHFHHPWVQAPLTSAQFQALAERCQTDRQKCFLLWQNQDIIGVINVSEIVRGNFQSAFLGFYCAANFAGQGWMSQGLKLLIDHAFNELKLHRLEANIQPDNHPSINLVKRHGFRQEGFSPRYLRINEVWCDHLRFAITAEEWRS